MRNEFDNVQTVERSAETDTLKQIHQATSPQSDASPVQPNAGRSTTKNNEKRSANTLYQEFSFQDNEESEENEVTGKLLKKSSFFWFSYFVFCLIVNCCLLGRFLTKMITYFL